MLLYRDIVLVTVPNLRKKKPYKKRGENCTHDEDAKKYKYTI